LRRCHSAQQIINPRKAFGYLLSSQSFLGKDLRRGRDPYFKSIPFASRVFRRDGNQAVLRSSRVSIFAKLAWPLQLSGMFRAAQRRAALSPKQQFEGSYR